MHPANNCKRRVSFFWIFQFIILCLCLSCGSSSDDTEDNKPSGSTEERRDSWTYMVYMGADNNLSSAGLIDLNEMESVGSDDKVKIVLQSEFSANYTDFSDTSYDGQTLRFLVKNDNNPDTVDLTAGKPIGNVNMASPDTLRDFILWASEKYPADRYALVIWDHGAGWKNSRLATPSIKGAVQDETSESFMSLPQLAKGVKDAGVQLDLLNFDACLMGMYEVAYEFRGLVDYMTFSEEIEPSQGDPYDTILASLTAKPSMSAKELATTIVNKYFEYYSTQERQEAAATKSAVDMSKIDALHEQVVRLADGIVSEFDAVSPVLSAAQNNTQMYEYVDNHDLVDFADYLNTHLASGTAKDAAVGVKSAVSEAIIANKKFGDTVQNSNGIAIYAPVEVQVSDDDVINDLKSYGELACNTGRASTWLDAVEKMSDSASNEVLRAGGFGFYIGWDTDADVDLYVWEPCEPQVDRPCNDTFFAPYMGKTTPNGYFSGDSVSTNYPEEYYVANDYVDAGDYDVLINYYQDNTSTHANVTMWYIDPSQGVEEWTQVAGPEPMDLSDPYPSNIINLNDINSYSDWWIAGELTRVLRQENGIRINSGERNINIHIQRKKVKPNNTDTKR